MSAIFITLLHLFLTQLFETINTSKAVYLSNTKFNLPTDRIDYIDKNNYLFFSNYTTLLVKYENLWGLPRVDAGKSNLIKLVKTQAQIGTDKYKFFTLTKDMQELQIGEDYYINFTIHDNAISSSTLQNNFLLDKNGYYAQKNPYYHDWKVECELISNPADFLLAFNRIVSTVKKMVSWGGLANAVFDNSKGAFVIKYNNLMPEIIPLNNK